MRKNLVGAIALAAVSVAVGWISGARSDRAAHEEVRTATVAPEARPIAAAGSHSPSVNVFDNGVVTIRADRVSPQWVLDELTRQGAIPASATGNVASTATDCDTPDAEASSEVDEARLVQALHEGTEEQRLAALTQALQSGVDLPPEVLRDAFEAGPSALRPLAFAAYIDTVSSDMDAVRAALLDGTYNDDAAVRADASARLIEFRQLEQAIAATPLQVSSVP